MSGPRWVAVGPRDELAARAAQAAVVVDVDGLEIALFDVGGRLCAIQNSCPHAGGPLAEGLVDGRFVECPWHGWSFDLTSGACRPVAARRARVFPLRVSRGLLEIGLEPEPGAGS